jgi:hypothetical protein
MTPKSTPRPKSNLQRLVDEFEPDNVYDAADLGTAFGMECSLAEQESDEDFSPSELQDG